MPLIPLLFGLVAQVAPALLGFFAGPKSADVADKVLAVASAVTGLPSGTSQADIAAKLSGDPVAMGQLQVQLAQLALQQATVEAQEREGQVDLNKVEAGSSSLFVAGWRPAFGWLCVAAVGYAAIFQGFIQAAVQLWRPAYALPPVNLTDLWPAFGGMLGISFNRTQEKMAGVATTSLAPFLKGASK